MALRAILVWPDERLKQCSVPVSSFDATLQDFLVDLEETRLAGPSAVGIAAPQVGCLQRIVIVDVSTRPKVSHHGRLVLINPVMVASEGGQSGREGCLSVPDYTGNVIRAPWLRVRYQDADGVVRELECEGFEARAIQHEIDHLDGLLFLDRVVSPRHDIFKRKS